MVSDFSFILYWWLVIFGIGVIFYPLTRILFGKFWDRGYVFSKILGILFVSYAVWLLGSLKILPFLNETIWVVILAAIAGNFWLFNRREEEFKKNFKKNLKIFAFEEILFFLALIFWSFIRGFQPNIQGLEKFMDYGFVNSILRSRYFPPADMWLAGETINYYYFGHLVSAVLTKLSGINSAITYNLMIATLFALCLTASFSFTGNLAWFFSQKQKWTAKKQIRLTVLAGLITAFLISFGSNLHPLYWWLKNQNFSNYWYPDATRFIVQLFGAADNTIHEFPIYSFVVADLHGHLLNLPNVLLFLALVLVIFSSKKSSIFLYFYISFLLGIFYMTNAWDFAIYNLVLGITILLFNYLKYKISLKTVLQTAKIVFPVFIGSLIFSLPFHLNFKNIASGIALADFHSPPWMLLVLWGFPLFLTLSYFGVIRLTSYKLRVTDFWVLALIGVSWLLIFIPEFIYVKDIYIHSYQRANTMFKLTYQSFVMFSLCTGYIILRIANNLKNKFLKPSFIILNSIFLFFVFIYPFFAIRSYYGLKNYQGLDGLQYLKKSYPSDYQAIIWLRNHVTDQPVIVEAVGESYTDFARVSANTGLPTILGWRVHEWLWRGSFDEPASRTEVVQEIYESSDLAKTKALLDKYQATYIFIGNLEKEKYPHLQEKKFSQLGEIIFSSKDTKIYQIKN